MCTDRLFLNYKLVYLQRINLFTGSASYGRILLHAADEKDYRTEHYSSHINYLLAKHFNDQASLFYLWFLCLREKSYRHGILLNTIFRYSVTCRRISENPGNDRTCIYPVA